MPKRDSIYDILASGEEPSEQRPKGPPQKPPQMPPRKPVISKNEAQEVIDRLLREHFEIEETHDQPPDEEPAEEIPEERPQVMQVKGRLLPDTLYRGTAGSGWGDFAGGHF